MKRSQQAGDNLDLCKRGKNHEAALCIEENLEHRSREGTSYYPIIEPKHRIFLSHSGAQKEFVEHLCEALEGHGFYPFFDKRQSSLPKGEAFPQLILEAAQQCELAIVVVSEEYFISKWPMIELHAFMQAYKSNIRLKIVPLFYGLSIEEFRDKRRRERWYKQWESFAKGDAQGRIKVDDWKDALNELGSFNGIPYDRRMKEIISYQNLIVSLIFESILPDIKWDDSHVQGKLNICKVIYEKIDHMKLSQKYKVKVVGIYGVGGIGKTTICKTLCNELSSKYLGKVCYVEFEDKNICSKELLKKILLYLNTSIKVLPHWNGDHCKDFLYRTLSRQRTFLAIDNVWDSHESIKQAKILLEAPFCEGSLVIVTSRSWNTLELLGIHGGACFAMPELGQEDAVNLFLYHAARGKQFKAEDKRDIEVCVQRCYFSKGDGQGFHYHPFALEALGLQLGCLGDKPSEWVENLSRVKNFSYFRGGNPVFDILRSSFEYQLSPSEQNLFMDLALYRPNLFYDVMEWLCSVYKVDEAEVKSRLDRLKARGLLQDVDLASGTISIHDLYRELVELEVRGKLDESTDLEKRRWVYVDNGDLSELESTPGGGCWHKLIRLGIREPNYPTDSPIESLEGIEWQYCSNVVVLKLVDLYWLRGSLNLERLKCLRSLELFEVEGLDRLEGLGGLRNLTYFMWHNFAPRDNEVQTHVGQFPASLKILHIAVRVLLGRDVLGRCKNLCKLVLREIRDDNLELSGCLSLQSVTLLNVPNLLALSTGFTARCASRFRSLIVDTCGELVDIPGLERLVGLELLEFKDCKVKPELHPDILQKLIKLQVKFKLSDQQFSSFSFSQERQELLCWTSEAPKFSGFEQLQVLDLIGNWKSLESMGDLPALQHMNISYCKVSSRLPDLSKSMNLEELNLVSCEVELHEEDICMLARLPLLHPVPVGGAGGVRLDLVRRKGLYHRSGLLTPCSWLNWNNHEWTERDLGNPPYRIRPDCIWDCLRD